jgi:hypothetical protein
MMGFSPCNFVELLQIDRPTRFPVFLGSYDHARAPGRTFTLGNWFDDSQTHVPIDVSLYLFLPVVGNWDRSVYCIRGCTFLEYNFNWRARHCLERLVCTCVESTGCKRLHEPFLQQVGILWCGWVGQLFRAVWCFGSKEAWAFFFLVRGSA